MNLRIHAIVLALNEEPFIANQLAALYPHCAGISVLTQYDRDWYGKRVTPDATAQLVMNRPDPEGKIHLVMRRFPDQAAALNGEMAALSSEPARGVIGHGSAPETIRRFHATPDYFWIVDADEFYDPATVPAMFDLLARERPRGMRVHAHNYLGTWNRRVPMETVAFCQFGFVKPDVRFTTIRQVSWNESRLSKLLGLLRLPDFSARAFGFIECPKEVAIFHHGCWLGGYDRLRAKGAKSAHTWADTPDYPRSVMSYPTVFVPTDDLPSSIRDGDWPADYFDGDLPAVRERVG
jgi:hypothetical protein